MLQVSSNSFVVNATSDILSCLSFQQQRPYLTAGRTFTEDEYFAQSKVCIIKYAALSIVRGGLRSMLLPVVALMVFLMFGQLILTSYNYDTQLRKIKAATIINGHFTDINGKQSVTWYWTRKIWPGIMTAARRCAWFLHLFSLNGESVWVILYEYHSMFLSLAPEISGISTCWSSAVLKSKVLMTLFTASWATDSTMFF